MKTPITIAEEVEEIGTFADVQAIHHVGPYEIVEYIARGGVEMNIMDGVLSSEPAAPVLEFRVRVDGHDTRESFYKLDEALVFAVGFRAGKKDEALSACIALGVTDPMINGRSRLELQCERMDLARQLREQFEGQ